MVELDDEPEPWNDTKYRKRGKERAVYWIVYLGQLDLAAATASLLKLYPEENTDERSDVRGNSCLAAVVLDFQGRPVEDKTFASSFAWGYGMVRSGRFRELAEWAKAEKRILTELGKKVARQDSPGKPAKDHTLDRETMGQVVYWLRTDLNLPESEVRSSCFAVRVPQWGSYNEPPEPEMLNSFFLKDLERVRSAFQRGLVGRALQAYMGGGGDTPRADIVRDRKLLEETLAPANFPLARWPGPGRFPLFLMQQAAVNHINTELVDGGLVAVNGPPGTGKTTLLRDVVAKVVLDRAIVMADFEKPSSAFLHAGSLKTGRAFTHVYKIDERLLGHEIVVASSNNNAVENISREIPSSGAVANDLETPPRYFQAVSDAVATGNGEVVDGATWGLAAAVLGNAANRSAFINAFWWHEKRGMLRYLKAILGDLEDESSDEDFVRPGKDSNILDVVALENPSRSEMEALARWKTRRLDFLKKYSRARTIQRQLQEVVNALERESTERAHLVELTAIHREATRVKQSLETELKHLGLKRKAGLNDEREVHEEVQMVQSLKPGFFSQIFRPKRYQDWQARLSNALKTLKTLQDQNKVIVSSLEDAERNLLDAKACEIVAAKNMSCAEQALRATTATVEEGRATLGINFADQEFWKQDDSDLQLRSPWISESFQKARDELFAASFALHQGFIDASARYLRHNLRAALEQLKGRTLSAKLGDARRSLWGSLFMVVPVISTTFASTSRLFGSLGREEIGWLLTDEAGQATPQAAVGAMWRAKRTVVIGDPLQIEPVVSTPGRLTRAIVSDFGLETDNWAAPEVSAQALADRNCWFGTEVQTNDGAIWVGSPLRVHRRCEDPMFSISNFVAYNGLMVYGTQPARSSIGDVLGESCWFHVDSDAEGKCSEEEGKIALRLLHDLLSAGQTDPDIFFITPFRAVAYALRDRVRKDDRLAGRLPEKSWTWVRRRIGTVHTFQGKEAEAVVLVLGAPLITSLGARSWAGGSPNLLNVAVTRAKRRLYVVGNKTAWKSAGTFSHLAQNLLTKA